MSKQYIVIDATTVLAVAPCISTEETRYYLCGVYVEPNPLHGGGAIAVATDGHTLAARRCAEGRADRSAILSLSKATMKALKATGHGDAWLVAELTAKPTEGGKWPPTRLTVVRVACPHDKPRNKWKPVAEAIDAANGGASGVIAHIEPGNSEIDATFPDWQRVVPLELPTRKPGGHHGFRTEHLVRFCKPGRFADSTIVVYEGDFGSPAMVLNDDPEFLGVIMPTRHRGGGLPEWFSTRPETAREPAVEAPSVEAMQAA